MKNERRMRVEWAQNDYGMNSKRVQDKCTMSAAGAQNERSKTAERKPNVFRMNAE